MSRISTRLPYPSGVISSMSLSANYACTSAMADVTGPWQIVVPANSGPITVGIPQALLSVTTGTNAAGTSFIVAVRIIDELSAVVAFNELKVYSSAATSQIWAAGLPVLNNLPNNSIQKTYKVQAQCSLVGTNGCTAAINTSAVLGTDPILLARRI
jgi:hypothetical protein